MPFATLLALSIGAFAVLWTSGTAMKARVALIQWIVAMGLATILFVHLIAFHTGYAFETRSEDIAFGIVGWQAFLLMLLWAFIVAVVATALLPRLTDRPQVTHQTEV